MYPFIHIPIINFPISTFGIMVAVGFLIGTAMAANSFERAGLDREAAWRMMTWCVIGGLAGAKLWYVGEAFSRDPNASLANTLFSRGGLTWYGGLIGGIALGAIGAYREKLSVMQAFDCAGPTLAIGQAIGRIGCFLVGDDWGRPTDGPLGIAFPNGVDPVNTPVHPTQLYEMGWLFLATAVMWRRRDRSRFLFGEYLLWAGAGRFVVEYWRKNPAWIGPLTNAQAVSVLMILGGLAWIVYSIRARPAAA